MIISLSSGEVTLKCESLISSLVHIIQGWRVTQIDPFDVFVAIIVAAFVLAAMLILGLSISHREQIAESRLPIFGRLLFVVFLLAVLVLGFILDILSVFNALILVFLLLVNILCPNWGKLKEKHYEEPLLETEE